MSWPKGKRRGVVERSCIGRATKAALAEPAVRTRMADAAAASWQDPAVWARRSAAIRASLAAPGKGRPHLRGMTAEERDAYRLFRRKGFSMAEALALLRRREGGA